MKVRAVLKLKHGAIAKALDERGWTQADLARATGLCPTLVGRVCNLDFTVSRQKCELIAEALSLDIDEVLPPQLERQRIESRFERNVEVQDNLLAAQSRHMLALKSDAPDDAMDYEERIQAVRDAIASPVLTERQSIVLRLRFGIDCARTHTLAEIAKKLGVCQERVRQLEAQAFWRIRESSPLATWASEMVARARRPYEQKSRQRSTSKVAAFDTKSSDAVPVRAEQNGEVRRGEGENDGGGPDRGSSG